ncbi:MAG: membrane protein insertase YidC [Syntrophaceae bacterium]|nr:membrane protein insertase YidC [Syntrophaceae bacterium]
MEKRAIYAILLTFFIIMLWSVIQSKLFPPAPEKPETKEVKKEQIAPIERPIERREQIKESKPLVKPRVVIEKKDVSVETLNYSAVLCSEDARLKHFRLKKYEDSVEQSSITIKLIQLVQSLLGKKEETFKKPAPLDLVNTSEKEGLPLGLIFKESGPSPSDGNWEVDREQLRLIHSGEKGEVAFTKSLENGLKVTKRYQFHSDQYTLDLDVEIENDTSKEITIPVGVQWIGKVELEKLADEDNKDYGLKYSFFKNQKVERKDLGGASASGCTPGCGSKKRRTEPFEFSDKGELKWFAYEGEYFASLLISPPTEKNLSLSVKGDEKNLLMVNLTTASVSIPPKQRIKVPYQIYLGPKEIDRLKGLGVGAEKLVDFGWFTIVAKPLIWFLKLTNKITGNFGIDIIILSILIKIVFLPLTQISMKSMKEMQKVQPEMNRLKEQYKNDKARLQQEIMLLYKRRKINPMSGCLPMLIQIPVFIALYNALQYTIEMRHAPFFLWIRDLAAKDPIYITPLIMGGTMVLQQKMTPTAADPTQAKMFLLMPVMFTFLFLNFPSGLVLYWLVNNVLSIAHQYYLNKKT